MWMNCMKKAKSRTSKIARGCTVPDESLKKLMVVLGAYGARENAVYQG